MSKQSSGLKKELRFIRITLMLTCLLLLSMTVLVSIQTYWTYKHLRVQGMTPYIEKTRDLYLSGDYEKILYEAEKRIQERPDDGYGYYSAGFSCYQLGRYQKAIEYLEKAQEIYPQWEASYTGPMIKEAKKKLSESTQP